MYRSCLEKNAYQRKFFDPSNLGDIKDYRYFMANGKWPQHQCPFILEWPYLTIPDMVADKFIRYTLGVDQDVD